MKEAMIHGYLEKDMTTYGSVHITPQGKKFLRKPTKFEIPIEVIDEDAEENIEQNMIGSSAADTELYSILKDLRKKVGKMHDVPPYVIFQDPSLEAMATFYPITMEELQNIPGVGAGKAKRYGSEFLKVIKEYVDENEIIRPEDLRVKTVAHKSAHKVAIIEAIDRRIAIDDLAIRFGMSMEEIVKEIEAIVYSGTKLNIRYFLEEVIDADAIEEIFDYFKHAENDNIKLAMQELGEDYYTEIEVRLVRIQFHSDLGN
jgi:ATP-dependent DNA helicase RecQ